MPLEDLIKRADTTDYDESVVKDMPEYPGMVLTSHVLLKNVQLGACLGSIASFGMWLKGPEPGFPSLVFRYWPRYAGYGGSAGILTGSAMMYFKMKTVDIGGLEDRAYRLGQNKGVQTMDFYSVVGGISCLLLGFSMRKVGGGGGRGGARGGLRGGAAAAIARIVSPWSLFAQGVAVGSFGYALGTAVGLPVRKPLELLRVPGFEAEEKGAEGSSAD